MSAHVVQWKEVPQNTQSEVSQNTQSSVRDELRARQLQPRKHPQLGVTAGDHTAEVVKTALHPLGAVRLAEARNESFHQVAEPPVVVKAEADGDFIVVDDTTLPLHPDPTTLVPMADTSVTVNGKLYTIPPNTDPRKTLAEFLRYDLGLTGTKVSCGEGGCGACTVMVTRPCGRGATSASVAAESPVLANACLRPVLSLANATVATVEGSDALRGDQASESIAEKLAAGNGSQCGFCSPGMVMAMYGFLAREAHATNPADAAGAERAFEGNLCRCTGYRPILEVVHGLVNKATPLPVQLPPNTTVASTRRLQAPVTGQARFHPDTSVVVSRQGTAAWFRPAVLADVCTLLDTYSPSASVQMVCGNTASGIAKYYAPVKQDSPSVFIDIAGLGELRGIDVSSSGATFGGAVSLSEVIAALASHTSGVAQALVRHWSRVAHWQVRDVGTWAGSLSFAKRHPDFPSDVALVLVAAGATVTLVSSQGRRILEVLQFMSDTETLDDNEVIAMLTLPLPTVQERTMDSFKVMSRHINAHAEVNAAFCINWAPGAPGQVLDACFVLGNITPGLFVATATTAKLAGRTLSSIDDLNTVLDSLASEVSPVPSSGDPNHAPVDVEYRRHLAQGLALQFLLGVATHLGIPVDPRVSSAQPHRVRPAMEAHQSFVQDKKEAPVNSPVEKLEALRQCTGKTRYTSDMPLPKETLFGAPVLATRHGVKITTIDATAALALAGVVAVVSAGDCDKVGASNTIAGTGAQVFATGTIAYVGQVVALVIADSYDLAVRAAKTLVRVSYNEDTPGITQHTGEVTAREGHESSSPGVLGLTAARGPLRRVTGMISSTGQKHFYMEPQSCLSIPDADSNGGLHVYASSQGISLLKVELCLILRKWASKITVMNSQVGGAYGGKVFLPVFTAAACTIASLVVGKPVLLKLDRNADCSMHGGRQPSSATFSADIDTTNARISSFTLSANVETGWNAKHGGAATTSLSGYAIPGAQLSHQLFATPRAMNTIMRAPGDFQGAFFTEAAIESLASTMDSSGWAGVVQEANLDPACSAVWAAMKAKTNPDKMLADARAFNQANRFRKRGVYAVPVKYMINTKVFEEYIDVTVAADGSITINHSGIELGQGINTKVAQAVAMELSKTAPVDLSLITTVDPKSTASFTTSYPTSGSGTSESVSLAAIRACDKLNKRLAKYRSATPGDSWQSIVAKAAAKRTDLRASGAHLIEVDGGHYPVACAAICEAEICVLTGETQLNSAQIFYDAGKSLNQAVDIGQIEGCFVQAMGFALTERQTWSAVDNRLVSNGTWDYKIPCALDVPLLFNTTLIEGDNTAKGAVLGSKATGEPAYLLGSAPFFAVKAAVYAARQEAGATGWFRLDIPATPERIQEACLCASPLLA